MNAQGEPALPLRQMGTVASFEAQIENGIAWVRCPGTGDYAPLQPGEWETL